MNFANVKNLTIPEGVVTKITDSQGRVLWHKPVDYTEPFYVENTTNEDEVVTFYSVPDGGTAYLWKSSDGVNWTRVPREEGFNFYVTVSPHQKMYFRYRIGTYLPTSLQILNIYKIGGNIMSLFYGDDFNGQTEFQSNTKGNVFNGIFQNNSLLTDASKLLLPATRLTRYCYGLMFLRCSSLTGVPELPATTLSELCYDYMFGSCTSLTTAPELLATRLVNKCYSRMFMDCTNLTYVKCLATTNVNETNCNNWLLRASNTGTFVKKSGISWSSNTSGIPSGWTVQEV